MEVGWVWYRISMSHKICLVHRAPKDLYRAGRDVYTEPPYEETGGRYHECRSSVHIKVEFFRRVVR